MEMLEYRETIMEQATMSRGFWERRALEEIGGIQVPWSQINALEWDHISKDCLPVIVYKSTHPKGVICANRMQLESIIKIDHEYVRECYIVEIPRLMKHSNLTYCEDTIELDRKFKHKKKKILSDTKKLLMKDIVHLLNRSKTAAEIGAVHGTSAFNVNQMAVKLRKPPFNFNIPGARGFDDFAVFADEIAKANPELVKKPLAARTPQKALFPQTRAQKLALTNNGH